MIGERIKRAREAAGFNQRELAKMAGITAMAISKYEREESTPSSGVLLALSKALGVRTEYFFRHTEVELEEVDYREHEKIPLKEEKKVLADVLEQLERWFELEQFLPVPWSVPFKLPKGLPAKINDYDDIEDLATKLRHVWDLGLGAIPELVDVLESKGIKVFITRYDGHKNFNGLTARVNDAPVIVVGKHWPGDRQRFTLAHELGHLVLKGRLSENIDEEMACHRFAGAFLAPKEMVFTLLGNKRSWLEPQELNILKQDWGLSMGGWTYRAFNLGILTKKTFGELWGLFNKNGWKEKEPEPQYPQEKTSQFEQLVFRALAEDIIGESKAAELLGMSVIDLHQYRKMESPNVVRHQ
ncbi:MAG: ImmA/IrrE family metallo-endopeptidase [Proteobacteria bacterium]|nr:helix-turn-helix domain-containing protein [Pseudomonadota bacterium]NOG60062.1 ImmA/IrrE family metallo-endopeptidase [Pseudomonadota bacterium]